MSNYFHNRTAAPVCPTGGCGNQQMPTLPVEGAGAYHSTPSFSVPHYHGVPSLHMPPPPAIYLQPYMGSVHLAPLPAVDHQQNFQCLGVTEGPTDWRRLESEAVNGISGLKVLSSENGAVTFEVTGGANFSLGYVRKIGTDSSGNPLRAYSQGGQLSDLNLLQSGMEFKQSMSGVYDVTGIRQNDGTISYRITLSAGIEKVSLNTGDGPILLDTQSLAAELGKKEAPAPVEADALPPMTEPAGPSEPDVPVQKTQPLKAVMQPAEPEIGAPQRTKPLPPVEDPGR